MNHYQIVMPNGDIIKVAADRMENIDGDLKFFEGNAVVGEARYWQAWTLLGKVENVPQQSPVVQPQITDPKFGIPFDPCAGRNS